MVIQILLMLTRMVVLNVLFLVVIASCTTFALLSRDIFRIVAVNLEGSAKSGMLGECTDNKKLHLMRYCNHGEREKRNQETHFMRHLAHFVKLPAHSHL